MNCIPFDKDILELAAATIADHGNEAMRQAAIYAHACDTNEDKAGSQTWDLVMHAIVELNRTSRRDGELWN